MVHDLKQTAFLQSVLHVMDIAHCLIIIAYQ